MIRTRHTVLLATALVLGACDEPTATTLHEHQSAAVTTSFDARTSDLLKMVRQETARFHSTEQAVEAGYVPTDHCVASPAGGMGMHWVNGTGLIDPVFDPARPEVLLYEPRPNGQPKLVAVEYIVINVGQPRPYFEGHPFDVGGTPTPVPHWSLHVWLYQDNPNGIFTPFNPTVSCS